MSFYRNLFAVVAAMGLATAAMAADESANPAQNPADNNASQAIQVADQSNSTAAATTDATDAKVNLNTATAKELMKVKGLNAAKAKSIVAYRKKHGNFNSVDDLKQVAGFKKMKDQQLKKITDQLTLG